MHNVTSIYTSFVHGLSESAVACATTGSATTTAIGCGVVVLSNTASDTTHVVIASGFLSHAHVLEVGIDVTYDILFRTLAFTFVHNHTSNLDHVYPVHFKSFWVSNKYLIAILDRITE